MTEELDVKEIRVCADLDMLLGAEYWEMDGCGGVVRCWGCGKGRMRREDQGRQLLGISLLLLLLLRYYC